MTVPVVDHAGAPVVSATTTVNGVKLHYRTAGSGPAVLLLHGVPKTSYYWRKVIPLLSAHHSLVVPDIRGLGDSEHVDDGYDMSTVAEDFAELMAYLGHEQYAVVGEDWGAVAGYQLAAAHPEAVTRLVFQEMLLPGAGLEDWSALTPDNVSSGHWLWHINFYSVPNVPELLLTGHEREYFSWFLRNECCRPAELTQDAVEEYIRCYSSPGGLRAMFNIYRASLTDAAQMAQHPRLTMPVLAVGSPHFIGTEAQAQMERVADDVTGVLLDNGGHQLAEECPGDLAAALLPFLSGEAS